MTNPETSGVELPEMDLLRKFDVPAPRYTSYPTADRFHAGFGVEDYKRALAGRKDEKEPADLSLYVHVPFCNDVCYYCGCNKIVTRDHSKSAEYIETIGKEAELVKEVITGSMELKQLHFGGGTPTYLTNDEFTHMMEVITKVFPLAEKGEFSIEVDPRTCPPEKVAMLRKVGLNRMSCGVQDFNADVQKAINRIQPFEMTKATIDAARAEGFESVNMDLIYGLPKQTRATFAETIDKVLELSPDRIALYHYAHLPNHFKAQRRILPADLPDTVEKVNIMFDAIKRLTANGYRYIGMDHFAKETDELSIAQKNGTLQRNFQGYSTMADCDMVALGVSSISKIGNAYACNPRELDDYYAAIREGRLDSWEDIHRRMDGLWEEYPKHKLEHAFGLLGLNPGNKAAVADLLDKERHIMKLICERAEQSRAKDFANPFRAATCRSLEETAAVFGTLEDDASLARLKKDAGEYMELIEKLKDS